MWLVYFLFCLSGCIGLVYEALWARYLKIFLGHSSYGQIITLVIYMGGLGAGSFISGKIGRRTRNAFLLYASIEFLVGMGGFVFHEEFVSVTRVFFNTVRHSSLSPLSVHVYKVLTSIALAGPVSVLLGMTFPALAIAVMRLTKDQGRVSLPRLYFTNSLGAAAGIVLTSYVLVPGFGTPGALALAAAGNMVIAAGFWFISRFANAGEKPSFSAGSPGVQTAASGIKNPVVFWLAIAAATGMSSFVYETGWTRLISLLLGSSTHAFDIMISAFILGLALGGLFSARILKKPDSAGPALAVIQVCMGGLALASLYLYKPFFLAVNTFNDILLRTEVSYAVYSVFKYVLCVALVSPASFFAGMTLPLLTYVLVRRTGNEKHVGYLYGWNTLGSIAGAALGGMVLLPALQLKMTIASGAFIDIGLGLLLCALFVTNATRRSALFGAALASSVPVFFVSLDPGVVTSGAFRSHADFGSRLETVTQRDGATATISFHRRSDVAFIKTNGKTDASAAPGGAAAVVDEYTQAALAFYPMSVIDKRYSAAVIGFGSGMTAHYLLCDPLLERVDIVEIEKEMVRLAKGFLPANRRVFEDSRARIVIDDAKTYFNTSRKTYDLIVSEPSNPWVSGVSGLFTAEFYRDVVPFLADSGLMVQWLHLYEFNSDLVLGVVKALSTTFPEIKIYAVPAASTDIVILASRRPFSFGPAQRFRTPDILEHIRLLRDDPALFGERNFLVTGRSLTPLLRYFRPNSDYFPILDNGAEKAFFLRSQARLFAPFTSTSVSYQEFMDPEMAAVVRTEREKVYREVHKNIVAAANLSGHAESGQSGPQLGAIENVVFSYFTVGTAAAEWDTLRPVVQFRRFAAEGRLTASQRFRFRVLDCLEHGDSAAVHSTALAAADSLPAGETGNDFVRLLVSVAVKNNDRGLLDKIYWRFMARNPAFEKTERMMIAERIRAMR